MPLHQRGIPNTWSALNLAHELSYDPSKLNTHLTLELVSLIHTYTSLIVVPCNFVVPTLEIHSSPSPS